MLGMGLDGWERALSPPTRTGRVLRGLLAVVLTAMVARVVFEQRGAVLGVATLAFYGGLTLWFALSPAGLRRWSARHVTGDAAFIVPMTFFALLLIESVAVWKAALVALGLGAIMLTVVVRRRRATRRRPAVETD